MARTGDSEYASAMGSGVDLLPSGTLRFFEKIGRCTFGVTVFSPLVQSLYQNLLQRAPTAQEISNANSAGLANTFLTLIAYPSSVTPVSAPNNEFMNTGTFASGRDHTNGMDIALLYDTILDRDLDAAGFNFWVGVANNGGAGILFQGGAGFSTRIQILVCCH